MGRHLIRAQVKAGEADLLDMLDWIAAYAAHHRDDRGRQVWEVQKRDDPEPLGEFGPLRKAEITLIEVD